MKLRMQAVCKAMKYCSLTSSSHFQTLMNVRKSQESVQMVFASIRLAASAVNAPLDSATMTCSWSVKVIWNDIIFYLALISMLALKGRGTFNSCFPKSKRQTVSFFVGLKSINQCVTCLSSIHMHMHLMRFVIVLCQAVHWILNRK